MGRVWASCLGMILALVVVRLAGPLGGPTTMLTAAAAVGAGFVGAQLGRPDRAFARGLWMLLGVVFAGLGFTIGALLMPDTINGLLIGGIIPLLLAALSATWTRSQVTYMAIILGEGAMTAVFATTFNLDPQGLNVAMPIALGQTAFPLALGFLAGVLIRMFVASDEEAAAAKEAEKIANAGVAQ